MKWNVFSLKAVKEALKPKFVLEKVRYVTDDEEYGEGKSTRLVFRNVEEMPEIDYIKRTVCTFIQDTYIHFKDKSLKPMQLWQDNLNESEDHIRYSTNNLVSPPLALIGETYISDESYFHKWLVAQGGNELLERASITIDVDVIYAYDNVDKVEKSSEDGEVHGVLINSTMYLRESEIKQVARLIKDEKLRNRVLTLMRSHRRIVSAPEKENRNIRESCIDIAALFEYGNKTGMLYGWNISNVRKLSLPMHQLHLKRAPQSWQYINLNADDIESVAAASE